MVYIKSFCSMDGQLGIRKLGTALLNEIRKGMVELTRARQWIDVEKETEHF